MARGSPYSPVNEVAPTNEGGDYLSVHANPDAFGAGVGEALQHSGAQIRQTSDEAMQYAEKAQMMANDAATNDVISNQWGPAVSSLSSDYRRLQGKAAIEGFKPYEDQLAKLKSQYVGQAKNETQKAQLSSYIDRHATSEMDSARRWQDTQLTKYEDESSDAFVKEQGNLAVSNYTDMGMVDQARKSMDAQILKHGLDRGLPMEAIRQNQRTAWGETSQGVISRALANGDSQYASQFYAQHKDSIPGPQQLEIDKTLHSITMEQTGSSNAKALLGGVSLPGHGTPTAQAARAATVQAATSSGINPNHALTVLRIETSDGQNLGKRGDILQTGEPAKDIDEQASNGMAKLKEAQTVADKAVGGQSAPWQQYAVFQQGPGGGPALLKAAQDNPTAKAADVLAPLYKNPKTALSAITHNGGNASMTSGQFLDFLKDKYEQNAKYCAISTPFDRTDNKMTPIPEGGEVDRPDTAPVSSPEPTPTGVAMQQGASPVQNLVEMDKVYPDALMRANQIPNLAERDATVKALEQQHGVYQAAANAWKTQFNNTAQNLAMQPTFVSIDQVPADMRAALADNPPMMEYLERRAKDNLEKSSGGGADAKTYGVAYWDLFQRVHSEAGAPGHIHDAEQLYEFAGKTTGITMSGFDKLRSEIDTRKTAEGSAEGDARKQAYKTLELHVTNELGGLFGTRDPVGEENWLRAMPLLAKAEKDARVNGVSSTDMYNPDSKDYIGNAIKPLMRTLEQQKTDQALASDITEQADKGKDALVEYYRNAWAAKDERAIMLAGNELVKRGWFAPPKGKDTSPQVQMAQ